MEEECGNQQRSLDILLNGLKFNPSNENLFIKSIKVQERMGNFKAIRDMIDHLKQKEGSVDKTWRMLLEGALFEGRQGNRLAAREQFKYLLKKCKTHGPIFLEASKFEERENQISEAVDICYQGLEYNVKYSPLWFQYLRLYEKASESLRSQKFDKLHFVIKDMFHHISNEFHWKVNIEVAQMYDRIGSSTSTNDYLRYAILESPDNVKWKLWLVSSRIMLNQGMMDEARLCIERACVEVPQK